MAGRGIIRRIFRFLFFSAILVSAILFLPNLPPHNVQFTSYRLAPAKKFEGALKVNTKLNNAERLFENLFKGPESLVHHNGILYTGVQGGHILKIVGNSVVPFVKFGNSCSGIHEEHICGRPLGLYIDAKKNLYAADAYYGIFKVNLTTGEVKQLINMVRPVDGRRPNLINAIAVASNGKIYWTDSDSNFDLRNLVFTLFADGTGRLIEYDPILKKNTVLMDNLHLANGVALTRDESSVVVAEARKCRLHKYYLKGSKKGKHEVFVDGLPGAPDNIKTDKQGNMFVSLSLARHDHRTFHVIFDISERRLLRKFLCRTLALLQTVFTFFDRIYPHECFKKAVNAVGHFETLRLLLPVSRVTIVKLNPEGEIIDSLHTTDGRIAAISEIEFVDNYAYLGSAVNSYLARVKLGR